MNESELAAVVKGIAPVIREYVDKALVQAAGPIVDTIKKSIDPLKARLDALEKRPLLKWAGTFKEGDVYPEGRLVTHQGSLWLAVDAMTKGTPGSEASGWRLIVKKGQAG